ncbi:MAG: phage scaffolding protein [Candidatus Saccharimonadales bacterium]
MNREALKELGLTPEQVDAVMTSHGKSVEDLKGKVAKVDALETQLTDLQGQLTDRDTQLDALSKVDAAGLQAEIDRLKDENTTTATDYQAKLEKQQFDFTLEKALLDAKVRNPKAVKALLDTESIKLDGDKLLNLDSQLEALQTSDSYLFDVEDKGGLKGRQPHVGTTPPVTTTLDDINKMSYTERVAFKESNPDQYNTLIKGE